MFHVSEKVNVILEFLLAVIIIAVFWFVTPCNVKEVHRLSSPGVSAVILAQRAVNVVQ
jgi:hypothetical protein